MDAATDVGTVSLRVLKTNSSDLLRPAKDFDSDRAWSFVCSKRVSYNHLTR
jgi:hypothetical protein